MPISDVNDSAGIQKTKKYLWTEMIGNHPTRNKRAEMDCRGRLRLRSRRPRGILSKGNKNVPGIVYTL